MKNINDLARSLALVICLRGHFDLEFPTRPSIRRTSWNPSVDGRYEVVAVLWGCRSSLTFCLPRSRSYSCYGLTWHASTFFHYFQLTISWRKVIRFNFFLMLQILSIYLQALIPLLWGIASPSGRHRLRSKDLRPASSDAFLLPRHPELEIQSQSQVQLC